MPSVSETVLSQDDAAARLRAAFPSRLASAVDRVLAIVPAARLKPTEHDIGPISIRGEVLHIPYRFYSEVPAGWSNLAGEDRLIFACIFSRHHNGHVRQQFTPELFSISRPWVPPFVIQLLGEYLPQVADVILSNPRQVSSEAFVQFVQENPKFLELTKSRMISYWNEYYRWEYQRFADFPAFKVLDELHVWKRTGVRNLHAR